VKTGDSFYAKQQRLADEADQQNKDNGVSNEERDEFYSDLKTNEISTMRSPVSGGDPVEFVFGTEDSTGIMAFFAPTLVDDIDMSTDVARIIATSMFKASFEAKYGAGDIAIQTIMEKMFKRIGGKFGSGLKSGVKKSNRNGDERGFYELGSLLFAPAHRTPRARLEWMNLRPEHKLMVTKPFGPVIRELANGSL